MRFLKIGNCFSAWSATPFRPFSIQAAFKTVRPHQTICWPCLIDGAAGPFTTFAALAGRSARSSCAGVPRAAGALGPFALCWQRGAAAAAVAKSSDFSPVFCCLFFSMLAYLLPAGALPCWPSGRLGSGAAALRRRRCARAGELALDLVSAGRAGTAAPDRNRLERTGALPGGPLRTT